MLSRLVSLLTVLSVYVQVCLCVHERETGGKREKDREREAVSLGCAGPDNT